MSAENEKIMVLVHPGTACGTADYNLGDEAPGLRDALAFEVMAWEHDLFVIDGEMSDELQHYAMLGLAVENALDARNRRVVRHKACDFAHPEWTDGVGRRFDQVWPGGPHDVTITGAWAQEDGRGCVDMMVDRLRDHAVVISSTVLRLPS